MERFLSVSICENENSKDKIGYNGYSPVNLKASSGPTYNHEKGLSLSNLHELRTQNFFRIIIGQVNINSFRNKLEPLKELINNNVNILMISETKIDETFLDAKFCRDRYSTSLQP